jgi:hypothetical protein
MTGIFGHLIFAGIIATSGHGQQFFDISLFIWLIIPREHL